MGWLTGTDGLETSWTVGTMTASASGRVEFDGEVIRFEDQKAYGDHNWGTIFPESWVWLQANDFAEPGTALAASGGTVDLGIIGMEASMIGLLLDGQVVPFRTQDLDRIEVEATRGSWLLTGSRMSERITIEAHCSNDTLFHLLVPTTDGMQPRAWESLRGTVEVTLERFSTQTIGWEVAYKGTSHYAGVEVGE
jgi:hypothetical protein